MTDRILEIIKAKGINASRFAEMVGVQRSAISHLVSGRNKPSLEFLQKVLNRFPDINPQWLFSGSGEMFKENKVHPMEPDHEIEDPEVQNEPGTGPMKEEKTKKEVKKALKRQEQADDQKAVDRIVIFYSDKTFREFRPE